jgi:hypothetical protein
VKIDKIEAARRTILLMADFLHREPRQLSLEDNLRKKWFMTDKDLEVLEIWIEGPISVPRLHGAGTPQRGIPTFTSV